MDKKSKHWADVLCWLEIVVDSCKTPEQSDNCMRLIQNFERAYEDKIGISECMNYVRPLKHKLWEIGDLSFTDKMKKLQVL